MLGNFIFGGINLRTTSRRNMDSDIFCMEKGYE